MDTTDQELFDAINTGAPPAVETQPEAQPEPVAEAPKAERDDQGRFAPKAAEEPQQPAQAESAREPAIPPSRLREEAEARRRAENELAELRAELRFIKEAQKPAPKVPEPQPMIDPIADPEGFRSGIMGQINEVREQLRHELKVERMNGSFDRANREKGETFKTALETFAKAANPQIGGDIRLRDEMLNSYDPASFVLNWHSRQTLLSEIGSDPSAYRQRLIDEWLADPANQATLAERIKPAQPATTAAPVVKLPYSLNRMTGSQQSAGTETVSDAELFQSTVSRRR